MCDTHRHLGGVSSAVEVRKVPPVPRRLQDPGPVIVQVAVRGQSGETRERMRHAIPDMVVPPAALLEDSAPARGTALVEEETIIQPTPTVLLAGGSSEGENPRNEAALLDRIRVFKERVGGYESDDVLSDLMKALDPYMDLLSDAEFYEVALALVRQLEVRLGLLEFLKSSPFQAPKLAQALSRGTAAPEAEATQATHSTPAATTKVVPVEAAPGESEVDRSPSREAFDSLIRKIVALERRVARFPEDETVKNSYAELRKGRDFDSRADYGRAVLLMDQLELRLKLLESSQPAVGQPPVAAVPAAVSPKATPVREYRPISSSEIRRDRAIRVALQGAVQEARNMGGKDFRTVVAPWRDGLAKRLAVACGLPEPTDQTLRNPTQREELYAQIVEAVERELGEADRRRMLPHFFTSSRG